MKRFLVLFLFMTAPAFAQTPDIAALEKQVATLDQQVRNTPLQKQIYAKLLQAQIRTLQAQLVVASKAAAQSATASANLLGD